MKRICSIVVDGINFTYNFGKRNADAFDALKLAIERRLTTDPDILEENTTNNNQRPRVIFPNGACTILFPDPADAFSKEVIDKNTFKAQVELESELKRRGWSIHHSSFKLVRGRYWMATCEDVAFAQIVNNNCGVDAFEPFGASNKRLTATDVFLVTSDKDHSLTLRGSAAASATKYNTSQHAPALRWVVLPQPCRDLIAISAGRAISLFPSAPATPEKKTFDQHANCTSRQDDDVAAKASSTTHTNKKDDEEHDDASSTSVINDDDENSSHRKTSLAIATTTFDETTPIDFTKFIQIGDRVVARADLAPTSGIAPWPDGGPKKYVKGWCTRFPNCSFNAECFGVHPIDGLTVDQVLKKSKKILWSTTTPMTGAVDASSKNYHSNDDDDNQNNSSSSSSAPSPKQTNKNPSTTRIDFTKFIIVDNHLISRTNLSVTKAIEAWPDGAPKKVAKRGWCTRFPNCDFGKECFGVHPASGLVVRDVIKASKIMDEAEEE